MARGRKKIENSKSELIHIRISEELSKSLESFCTASNITKSEAVRLLLENLLK
jgi:antitoxin component of RelBE/YafQ-DinJ toxin-antitoxin module